MFNKVEKAKKNITQSDTSNCKLGHRNVRLFCNFLAPIQYLFALDPLVKINLFKASYADKDVMDAKPEPYSLHKLAISVTGVLASRIR